MQGHGVPVSGKPAPPVGTVYTLHLIACSRDCQAGAANGISLPVMADDKAGQGGISLMWHIWEWATLRSLTLQHQQLPGVTHRQRRPHLAKFCTSMAGSIFPETMDKKLKDAAPTQWGSMSCAHAAHDNDRAAASPGRKTLETSDMFCRYA